MKKTFFLLYFQICSSEIISPGVDGAGGMTKQRNFYNDFSEELPMVITKLI